MDCYDIWTVNFGRDIMSETSGAIGTCVKYFWARVKISRFNGKNYSCVFSGEIENLRNLSSVKHLTNSMSVLD